MKVKLFFLFALLIYPLTWTQAQVNEVGCGTAPLTDKQRTYIQQQIRTIPTDQTENSGTTCIPIKIFIFNENDGTGGVSTKTLADGLTFLNSFYYDAGIEFFYCDGFTYINNSDMFTFDERSPDNDTEADLVNAAGQVGNAVNIYFVGSITLSSGFDAAGYAYYPNDAAYANRILMTAGAMNYPNGTYVHEFGHYFSLPHTHEGTEGGPNDPNAESVARNGANANCGTAGDGFCDTAADPKDNAHLDNTTCTYTATLQDAHGDTYMPPTDNIMSYYSDKCGGIFTPSQYTAIAQGLATRQGHTAYDYSCAPASIPVPTNFTIDFSGVSNNLSWTDAASGATNDLGYIVERSTTSANSGFSAIIKGSTGQDGTSYADSDIQSNTTYWYRVKPTNGACNNYSAVATITTGNVICSNASLFCSGGYISRVQFGSIDQSSGCDNYKNYTLLSTNLQRGTTYSITVTNGHSSAWHDISIWVDWNHDGDFDDTDESQVCILGNGGTGTYNIAVPANAPYGKTIMRVKIESSETNPCNPCAISNWGEVEDYTVNIPDPLPIELQFFDGEQKGLSNLLSWKTESEINSDFITLERSIDGKNFLPITRIKAKNSPSSYQYLDQTPFNGANYYRLKMVDFDDHFDYSEIISVSNKRALQTLMVYPNPAQNQIRLALSSSIPDDFAQVFIFDAAGKVVVNKTMKTNPSIQLDIHHLPKGLYTAKVSSATGVFISRFTKLQ